MPFSPELTRRSLLAAAATGLAAGTLARPARAIDLDITDGNIAPVPIAIPAFGGDPEMARSIAGVVQADLQRSGLFVPLNPASFIDHVSLDQMPNFQNWKAINAQALVIGNAVRSGDHVEVMFRVWDVLSGKALAGQQFAAPLGSWRRVAHKVADVVYSRMTGESRYFDSRIVFVDESGPKTKRVRRLAVMDSDGANLRYITRGADQVATPRFSPQGQVITYMAFGHTDPQVYVLNIDTGQQTNAGSFSGMSFAPRFAPDGRTLVMSLSNAGITNLYQMQVGGQPQRLTDSTAIDTSPSYSPDGRQIAFESDRSGTQQIYVMSSGGGGAQRISFAGGSYATPSWSPRGDLIAFTKIGGGGFAIGVMKPDGSAERILTEGYHNEGPTWSPNGRVLMFFRDLGPGPKLFTIDLTGRNEQQLPTPNFASAPSWGPLLP